MYDKKPCPFYIIGSSTPPPSHRALRGYDYKNEPLMF